MPDLPIQKKDLTLFHLNFYCDWRQKSYTDLQMPANLNSWTALASTLRNLSQLIPNQSDRSSEADLYYRRACLAAAEERFDVALVFCAKAVDVEPQHLPARLLLAKSDDKG